MTQVVWNNKIKAKFIKIQNISNSYNYSRCLIFTEKNTTTTQCYWLELCNNRHKTCRPVFQLISHAHSLDAAPRTHSPAMLTRLQCQDWGHSHFLYQIASPHEQHGIAAKLEERERWAISHGFSTEIAEFSLVNGEKHKSVWHTIT